MTDLFDTVINADAADRPAFRQAPPADYLVVVREAKKIKASSGTPGIQLDFTIRECLSPDANMDGVDLAKCRLSDTLYVTEKTIDFVKEKLVRINSETQGVTLTEAMDVLPGSEVVVRLDHLTTDRNGQTLRTPRLEVKSYYTLGWYMNNRKAA